MYRWYEKSVRCYAYLHDVPQDIPFPAKPDRIKYSKFNGWPEWFSCGWTLQELITPHNVQFFNENWQFIGDKEGYFKTLHDVTHQTCLVLWTWRKLADELMRRTHPRSVERLSRLEGYRQPSLSISCKVKTILMRRMNTSSL